jgi:hypothetical protein
VVWIWARCLAQKNKEFHMNKHKVVTAVVGLMALGGSVTGVALATTASATTPTTIVGDSGPNDQSGSQSGVDVTGGSASETASSEVTSSDGTAEATTASDGAGGHQDAVGVDVQLTGEQ